MYGAAEGKGTFGKIMTTPSMAFSVCARNAAAAFAALWLAAMVVTRLYALHEEYVAELGIRNDERWLVEKCKVCTVLCFHYPTCCLINVFDGQQEPEFYANLRQHSDLCTRVANNAHASIALRVLSRVMERSTHLCGDTSCADVVAGLAARFGWHAVAVLAATMVLAPNLLLLMMRAAMQRRSMYRMEEEAMLFDHHGAMYSDQHRQRLLASEAHSSGWFSPDKSFPLTSAGACRRSLYFNRPIQYIGNGPVSSATTAAIIEAPDDDGTTMQAASAAQPHHHQEQPWFRVMNAPPATTTATMGFDGGVARLI